MLRALSYLVRLPRLQASAFGVFWGLQRAAVTDLVGTTLFNGRTTARMFCSLQSQMTVYAKEARVTR